MDRSIIICTEPNFEWKSRLLVRSIRTFGGEFSCVPIVSYSPRPDHKPSASCLREFKVGGVESMHLPLNVRWPKYPLANKILVCAHAEQTLNSSRIAFIDSDQIILGAFGALFETTAPFSARPVDKKNIGVCDSSDLETQYWDAIYGLCGVKPTRTVITNICLQEIKEYYNSGMFSVARDAGILSAWKAVFERVMAAGLRPKSGTYFIEQSCLAAAVSSIAKTVVLLPQTYNVPCEMWFKDWIRGCVSQPIEATPVSFHYHDLFDHPRFDDALLFMSTLLSRDEYNWLIRNIRDLRSCR